MSDESNATANGEATTDGKKSGPAKAKGNGMARKTAKKTTRAKKTGVKKKASSAVAKKTAGMSKPTSSGTASEPQRGIPPDRSLRFLLLAQQEENAGKSDAAIARMVVCSASQIGKIRADQKRYEKMIAEMGEEEKQRRLATVIESKPRGKSTGVTKAKKTSSRKPQGSTVARNEEAAAKAAFRTVLNLVGRVGARRLLEEAESEE